VQDPEAAELLLRQVTVADHAVRLAKVSSEREQRWGRLRLLAERRYGELLGPAKHGGSRTQVTGGDLKSSADTTQANRARKVAAVPKTEFDEYVDNEPRPTRSGLFRKTAPPPRERKRHKNTSPLEAAERLRQRVKQVRSLDSRVRPRWTLEDCEDVESGLKHPPKRQRKYAGKRLRDLAGKRRNGHELANLQYRMVQLVGILESVDVTTYDLADADDVSEFHDDLIALQIWMDRSISLASNRLDDAALERKIRKLCDTSGRTEAERETAARLADKLERRRRESQLS
jgi:hypothetical protein